jgi:hydrogenase maturation factor HypF (carbamoyltransferase family)
MSPKQNENESLMQAYQQTLLMTDARIIAENDDSIVVAVKISKEFIRKNHGLLLALSECVGR